MTATVLVKFAAIPEISRFAYALDGLPARGQPVVVETHRGPELGTVLDVVRGTPAGSLENGEGEAAEDARWRVLRNATADDLATHGRLHDDARTDFIEWRVRIEQWNLNLELIDVEWTLDRRKLILYVLGDRGAETTKLALQAAAQGTTVIEVQPVAADGVVPMPAGGGGGCGSGGCGCHH